jgi:hypothetical protein
MVDQRAAEWNMSMKTNKLPSYDASDNPTECCPRFNPEGWNGQDLHFADKLFVRAQTRSLFHIPINMGRVFKRVSSAIQAAGAQSDTQYIVLSHDLSPWSSEHYFAVAKDVPGEETCRLSGDFVTKVFEGPYGNAPKWERELENSVKARGQRLEKVYFFYTTCPRCAKHYGKNYVVGVAQVQ